MKNVSIVLLLLVIMTGGMSCAKYISITKTIIEEVGGAENTKELQCYLSKEIILTLVERSNSSTIIDGQLIRKNKTAREKINIPKSLMGLVREGYDRPSTDGFLLNVAFEEYTGDPFLAFGQYRDGVDERYYLLYKDSKNKIVEYGGNDYKVSYEGSEAPYLTIKSKSSYSYSAKSRKVKGLKLGK